MHYIIESPNWWWAAYKYACTDENHNKWNLAKYFKNVLCTPPSSVISECLFSSTGNNFEAKQSRLLPEHGEQIAFLN